jgi:hypothetical protein
MDATTVDSTAALTEMTSEQYTTEAYKSNKLACYHSEQAYNYLKAVADDSSNDLKAVEYTTLASKHSDLAAQYSKDAYKYIKMASYMATVIKCTDPTRLIEYEAADDDDDAADDDDDAADDDDDAADVDAADVDAADVVAADVVAADVVAADVVAADVVAADVVAADVVATDAADVVEVITMQPILPVQQCTESDVSVLYAAAHSDDKIFYQIRLLNNAGTIDTFIESLARHIHNDDMQYTSHDDMLQHTMLNIEFGIGALMNTYRQALDRLATTIKQHAQHS